MASKYHSIYIFLASGSDCLKNIIAIIASSNGYLDIFGFPYRINFFRKNIFVTIVIDVNNATLDVTATTIFFTLIKPYFKNKKDFTFQP